MQKHMSLEDIYARGHKRNTWVMKKLVELVDFYVRQSEGEDVSPAQLEVIKLGDGSWSQALVDYGNFKYIEGTLFDEGFKFPDFSIAPYLQAEYLKCFIMCMHETDYAYSTLAGIIVPTWKRFIRGLTGHYPDLNVENALSSTLSLIGKSPKFGRMDSNSMGKSPSLPDDTAFIIKMMPRDLTYYAEEAFVYSLGQYLGPRSVSVNSMKNSLITNVVESTSTTSRTTKKPLLFLNLV